MARREQRGEARYRRTTFHLEITYTESKGIAVPVAAFRRFRDAVVAATGSCDEHEICFPSRRAYNAGPIEFVQTLNRGQTAERPGNNGADSTDGDPGAIRTRDLQIRNLALYPAELRGHPDG